jgi:branched-chain amino acid aminotransferase
MTQLQRPAWVFMNGRLTKWDDALIHVSSEALIRGISVFEGIKGYWCHENRSMSLLALRQHYDRLSRSAMLVQLPFEVAFDNFVAATTSLVRELQDPRTDLWLRPTVLAVDGNWGLNTVTDLVITCYQQRKISAKRLNVGFSAWQKPGDNVLPARVKSAANYQMARLARMEGRQHGFDEMIFLNQAGRVAEATGACVIMVREGQVITPPTYEGCLESITVDIVEGLCRALGVPFLRRPIDRTELMVAEEVALLGTLLEIGVVDRLDQRQMHELTPILDKISAAYWACVRGRTSDRAIELTPV